jgi:DNA-binding NarL/FixJ family response regulator
VRIVIVEDHSMFRELVRKVCGRTDGCAIVGEADAGELAVQLILEQAPDLVILDLSLPDIDGFEVIKRTSPHLPETKFLALSSYTDEFTLYRVDRVGLSGFVDKNTSSFEALRKALASLQSGLPYFSPTFMAARTARMVDARSFTRLLSTTEQELLTLIGLGLSDEEIAQRLGIAASTAQTHRRNIAHKLQLSGTPKLIAYAHAHGLTALRVRHPGGWN